MPYSFQLHTATSGQTTFSFASIDGFVTADNLRVYVNGVLQATSGVYTVNTTTFNVVFNTGRTAGTSVLIRRFTDALRADREVDFVDGSILTAADLDNSALQLLYLVQEGLDEAKEFCLRLNDALTAWDAKNKKITNVATPTLSTDAATKGYVDAAAFGAISGAANQVLATPNGASGSLSVRSLVAADIPTLTAAKISDFDTQVRTNRLDQMASPLNTVSMNSNRLITVANPVNDQDAATKNYCDTTFLNPDPLVFTSTYSSGSYSNTSNIVTNVGSTGLVQMRLNGHILPIRRVCVVDGIVGPFSGTANGPHWFSLYNGSGSAIRFRILQADFDWVSNQLSAGFNIPAPVGWNNPWESPNQYNAFSGSGPFLAGVIFSNGLYTVNAGADYKFYGDDPTYWTGDHTSGVAQVPNTPIGVAPGANIANGVRVGTYARISMTLIRMT